jgi:hypothetical protein
MANCDAILILILSQARSPYPKMHRGCFFGAGGIVGGRDNGAANT